MEFLVKDLATSIKSTEDELSKALGKLGFTFSIKKRLTVVTGKVKHALLLDGSEITADKATSELAAIAIEFSKSIIDVATVVVEFKGNVSDNKSNSSELASDIASTIEKEVELDELEVETVDALETAKQAILQREANKNTVIGDVLGAALEADLIEKTLLGRANAWKNPHTRKALESLINQSSQHTLATLLGKPSSDGKMKLKSVRSMLATTLTVDTTSTEVPETLPAIRTAAPLKVLTQAGSTNNSTTTAN